MSSNKNIFKYNIKIFIHYKIIILFQHLIALGSSLNVKINNHFLHDIPQDILKQYPDLIYLIEQCSRSKNVQSRIELGRNLKNKLDDIINNFNNFF